MTSTPDAPPRSLNRTVYAFGSPSDKFYGHIVLQPDGTIYGVHPATHWRREDGILVLCRANGDVESRYHLQGNVWSGNLEHHKWPLVLVPVLENHRPEPAPIPSALPPIFINSIPKSGTYFLEKALARLGWRSLRLHLCTGIVDDYRGLSDDEVHVNPSRVRIACPEDQIAATLQPGDLIVGHLVKKEGIERVKALGVKMIPCIRNLRDVLVSLYRFKRDKVASVNANDAMWRQADEAERFDKFLEVYRNDDVRFVHNVALCQLLSFGGPEHLLRYEDMESGSLSPLWREKFEEISPALASDLEAAMGETKGSPTPTYSGRRSRWQDHWSEKTEAFFKDTGLHGVNRRLGYEE